MQKSQNICIKLYVSIRSVNVYYENQIGVILPMNAYIHLKDLIKYQAAETFSSFEENEALGTSESTRLHIYITINLLLHSHKCLLFDEHNRYMDP